MTRMPRQSHKKRAMKIKCKPKKNGRMTLTSKKESSNGKTSHLHKIMKQSNNRQVITNRRCNRRRDEGSELTT